VRFRVGPWDVRGMAPGEWRQVATPTVGALRDGG